MMNEIIMQEWIDKMPIGTPVRYYPYIKEQDNFIQTVTRSLPWELESGAIVVMIKGKAGCVSVRNIQIIPEIADPLLQEAKDHTLKYGKVSVSHLQRIMRIGFTRAARLVDLMVEDGFCARNEEGQAILVTFVPKEEGAE